ncbi:MAG: ATP-dependent Clp protease adapter ClpS [Micavibrio aeruginosavorus]|uniref:ATP-dependent Clp protease adapter protein ClpS n=1 Tax=Micavibrio aeruginosavorus TaxID=349221 RepID=A0A7T5R262_9BACT|nr:MAG: ATP-dependent Clp protease adapter ClpS [Micavibrio aeruginosavorus]
MSTEWQKQDDVGVIDRIDIRQGKPKMYSVVLHNDDFTPMDFVTTLLSEVFNKNEQQATQLMLKVHNEGKAVAGTYTRDVAETKQNQSTERAQREEHPLRVTVEPA